MVQPFNQKEYEKSTPLSIQVNHPTRQSMYCVKCRKKVELVGTYKKLKNGSTAIVAPHHCGCLVYKIVGKLDFEV